MRHAVRNSPNSETTQDVRRVINRRRLCVLMLLVVSVISAGTLLYEVHKDGARRFLRELAFAAMEDGDAERALAMLHRLRELSPGDVEVQDRLSRLLVDVVGTREALMDAYHLNEGLLRGVAPQAELRLRHVALCLRLKDYSSADAHLRTLRVALPDSSDVAWYSGVVAQATRRLNEAHEFLSQAIERSSPRPEAFVLLAAVRKELPEGRDDSEALMARMIACIPGAAARRTRAAWYLEQRQPERAIADLQLALRDQPADLHLNELLVQAVGTVADSVGPRTSGLPSGYTAWVRAHLESQRERSPHESHWYRLLATVLWHEDRHDDAVAMLRDGGTQCPGSVALPKLMVEFQLECGQWEEAQRLRRELPPTTWTPAEAKFLNGRIRMWQRDWHAAATELERAVAMAGDQTSLRVRAGICLAVCRRNTDDALAALNSYRSAAALDPYADEVQRGLAEARWEAGQQSLAIVALRDLAHIPGVPEQLADLLIQRGVDDSLRNDDRRLIAELLDGTGDDGVQDAVERALLRADYCCATARAADALTELQEAMRQYPDSPELARALHHLTTSDDIRLLERLQAAAAVQPDAPEILAAIVSLLMRRDDSNQAESALRSAAGLSGHSPGTTVPRMRTAIRAARFAEFAAARYGHARQAKRIRGWALNLARELVDRDVNSSSVLTELLVQSGEVDEALRRVHSLTALSTEQQAHCWLEFARHAADPNAALTLAGPELRRRIQEHPASVPLRLVFADMLLYASRLDEARPVIEQICRARPSDGALARRAWIRAATGGDSAAVQADVDAALRLPADDSDAAGLAALALLRCNKPSAALEIAAESLTASAVLARAAALAKLDRRIESRRLAVDALRLSQLDPLRPPDVQLLQELLPGQGESEAPELHHGSVTTIGMVQPSSLAARHLSQVP